MKKFSKKVLSIFCAFALTLTMNTTAFAHSPTDPNPYSCFLVSQGNSSSSWFRQYLFQPSISLPNDGPLFLANAVNDWNWIFSKNGLLFVDATFLTPANYRLLIISPDGSNIYYDNTYSNTSRISANIQNTFNAGVYRILVFSDNPTFELQQYLIAYNYL